MYSLCSRCFIFFVKQKSAYEMRISDWSSDVCSSDLLSVVVDEPGPAAAELRASDVRELLLELIEAAEVALDALGKFVPRLTTTLGRHAMPEECEIGRASCRERGCQYG